MSHEFWAERWGNRQIGFHLPVVNRHLLARAGLLPPAPARVLVPLCGKSQDLVWLRDRGYQVVGVEFVEAAAREFFAEQRLEPAVTRQGRHLALSAGAITILVDDFLALDPGAVGTFAAAWDRAALVAMPAEQRAAYLVQLRRLVASDGRVLLVSFDHDLPGGPPFSVPEDEIDRLCGGLFSPERIDVQDVLSEEPRFRERGATRMSETVFLLRSLSSQF
jgi:thiopurine S-methyltransferase